MTPAKHQQNWLPGIFNDFFGNEWIAKTSSAAPAINIVETEKEYEVQIAAPGHYQRRLRYNGRQRKSFGRYGRAQTRGKQKRIKKDVICAENFRIRNFNRL